MLKFLRPWIFAFGFTLLLIWVVGGSQSFQHCIREKQQQSAGEQLQKSISEFLLVRGSYRDCIGGFIQENAEATIAAFTVVLAFSTIFLWAATRDIVEGSERTAKRQLRAYVVTKFKEIVLPEPGEDRVIALRIDIKNTGQTPAYNLQTIVRTRVVDYPFPASFDFSIPPAEDPSRGTLGPQQCVETEGRSDHLTTNEWDQIWSPKSGKRLCTWGTVTYRDIFKVTQHTNFCVSTFSRESGGRVIIEGHTCDRHNDAS